MTNSKTLFGVRLLFALFIVEIGAVTVLTSPAAARAGGGRSIGRPSGGGFGSGYRRSAPPPASQPYANPSYNRPGPGNPTSQPSMTPPPSQPSNRGSFLRGLGGGLAGGFLGSMLFSSLGHAGGGYGGGMGGGGGLGFLEILLFAGLAFLGYRWWKNRQAASASFGAGGRVEGLAGPVGAGYENVRPLGSWEPPVQEPVRFPALVPESSQAIEKDQASDLFFRVQGAWTRRDLKPVSEILGPEIELALSRDVKELLTQGKINRLENISVRSTDVLQSWREKETDYSTVRFLANLLDYTVEEKSGHVVEGSDTSPVKFAEDWTFARTVQDPQWRIVSIEQI